MKEIFEKFKALSKELDEKCEDTPVDECEKCFFYDWDDDCFITKIKRAIERVGENGKRIGRKNYEQNHSNNI